MCEEMYEFGCTTWFRLKGYLSPTPMQDPVPGTRNPILGSAFRILNCDRRSKVSYGDYYLTEQSRSLQSVLVILLCGNRVRTTACTWLQRERRASPLIRGMGCNFD